MLGTYIPVVIALRPLVIKIICVIDETLVISTRNFHPVNNTTIIFFQ
jgi:hypothetical protein